jgi:hypothetical protein
MMFDYMMSEYLQGISSRPQDLLPEELNNFIFIKSFPSIQVITTGLGIRSNKMIFVPQ